MLLDEPENVFAASGDRLSGRMLGMEDGIGVTELGAYGGRYAEASSAQSKTPVPQEKAKAAAADFFGLDADKLEVEYTASDGTVCFGFDGGSVCVDASGSVLSLSSERSVAGDIDSDELERTAREFLAAHGFGELYLVSSERLGSVQTMVFDCVRNGVRCMGDSVRISVAGDGRRYPLCRGGAFKAPRLLSGSSRRGEREHGTRSAALDAQCRKLAAVLCRGR